MSTELMFVYNADASLFAQVTDAAHKVLSSETYQCNLCKISYSALAMKKEWREYLQTLPFASTFLHRDEFRVKYPSLSTQELPAVFLIIDGNVSTLLSAEELNAQATIGELKELLNAKVASVSND